MTIVPSGARLRLALKISSHTPYRFIISARLAESASTTSRTKLQAKRVFLRQQVEDFSGCNPSEYNDETHLAFAGRLTSEWEEQRHFAHIEPFQDPEIRQARFHITLDMEQALTENPNFGNLPHEMYRVRRDVKGEL